MCCKLGNCTFPIIYFNTFFSLLCTLMCQDELCRLTEMADAACQMCHSAHWHGFRYSVGGCRKASGITVIVTY